MILVPLPHPGVVVKRMPPLFGYDEAPHGHAEVVFDSVRVPVANMLLGEGLGYEIAQSRPTICTRRPGLMMKRDSVSVSAF